MRHKLEVLEEWAGALLAKLEPGQRRKLLGQVARDLRWNQQRRIAAQKAPDGTAYAPRKRARGGLRGKRGRIRSQMFVKLQTARWMRTEVSAAGVAVGFVGRVGRIARAHQLGREIKPLGNHFDTRLPLRKLLCVGRTDMIAVRNMILNHLIK